MAIAFLMEFPDITLAQYDAVVAETNPTGKVAPGGVFHVVGPYEGGLRIVDVWESQEAFDTFLRERLQAALLRQGIAPPRVESWAVHSMLQR
jgi:hypothetical protein